MSDGGRTPEERERARLEREARRAARQGKSPSVPPPTEPPPAASSPSPAESLRPEPEVPSEREPAAPLLADEREPTAGPATEVRPPEPPAPFVPDGHELPPLAPRVRKSAAERRAAATQFLHGRGGRGGGGTGRPRPTGLPRRRPRPATIATIAGGLAMLLVAWFLLSLFQPLKGSGSGEVTVTIPKGSSVGEIADILERRGVIASAFFFRTRVSLAGSGNDFKAGAIQFHDDMSYSAAMDTLTDPPTPEAVTITIPEGLSRPEAKEVVGDSLRGDYLAASKRSPVLDPADYGGRRATSLEGFLFPATYQLKPGQPVRRLVDQQLVAFKRELAGVDLRYAKGKNLTAYDVLTIASMVEREVQVASERRVVASVIYNRLSQGIPLGIDATIRFATGNWSDPLKQSELAIDSPYNTRTNQGLPPGPIGNPGIAAINAAAHPASTDYIYYVVKPCGNGEHAFSTNDADFQRNVERYNSERASRGGQSPTDC